MTKPFSALNLLPDLPPGSSSCALNSDDLNSLSTGEKSTTQPSKTNGKTSGKTNGKTSGKIFGTDGIRGLANQEPMTCATINRIASILGLELMRGNHRHLAVIGKDTRVSGYMFESAITAGLVAAGMDVRLVGPLPTPAIAWLTRSLRADLGVVVSASHNPYCDNGVKFFGPDGNKISLSLEQKITQIFLDNSPLTLAPPDSIGQVKRLNDAQGRYIEFAKNTFPKGLTLNGWKIVVDCAHGATYQVAPAVLWELGAEVITIGNTPNGFNINNQCGATATAQLQAAVVTHQAHLGIAFDGDGDRVIMCDENGKIIDGDHIMANIARYMHEQKSLKGDSVIATVMSNLGLERFLQTMNLKLVRTPVGDRYVSEYMRKGGFNLGGEQSGHIILSDYNTTGDGIIAALQVLSLLVERQIPASSCQCFEPYPQILESIAIASADGVHHPEVNKFVALKQKELGEEGRILIRLSGTEPVARIMVEGENLQQITAIVQELKEIVAKYSI